MPLNTELSSQQYARYVWCRDHGHQKYVLKADKCKRFFLGDQWDTADKAMLSA